MGLLDLLVMFEGVDENDILNWRRYSTINKIYTALLSDNDITAPGTALAEHAPLRCAAVHQALDPVIGSIPLGEYAASFNKLNAVVLPFLQKEPSRTACACAGPTNEMAATFARIHDTSIGISGVGQLSQMRVSSNRLQQKIIYLLRAWRIVGNSHHAPR